MSTYIGSMLSVIQPDSLKYLQYDKKKTSHISFLIPNGNGFLNKSLEKKII